MKLYILKETNNIYDVEGGTIAVCTSPEKAIGLMKTIVDEEKDASWDEIDLNINEKYKDLSFLDINRKDGAYRYFEIVECLTDEFI